MILVYCILLFLIVFVVVGGYLIAKSQFHAPSIKTEEEIPVEYYSQQINRSIRVGDCFSRVGYTDTREVVQLNPMQYILASPDGVNEFLQEYFQEEDFLDEGLFVYLGNIND